MNMSGMHVCLRGNVCVCVEQQYLKRQLSKIEDNNLECFAENHVDKQSGKSK